MSGPLNCLTTMRGVNSCKELASLAANQCHPTGPLSLFSHEHIMGKSIFFACSPQTNL